MNYSLDTKIVHGDESYDLQTGAISFPIYQSATFRHRGFNDSTGFDYSREKNPTRHQAEKAVAVLEGGQEGYGFSTGMAAVAALMEVFEPGDHLIVSDDLYGGTYRLFKELGVKRGLSFTYADTSCLKKVEGAVTEKTRAIFIETPTNPMMKISDINSIAEIARANRLLMIVDNTFLTPYCQQPLSLGADIVLHSGTKFLGGHNDTLAGFIVIKEGGPLADRLREVQKTTGGVLAPFDSWLLLRGIKTLGIRMERQQHNAMKIAQWLLHHKNVERVYYPGLESHPGYEISKKQATGFGAMLSFSVKSVDHVKKILNGVRLIAFAESLGGVESLITYPLTQTHAAIPRDILEAQGITDKLLRLSVGIEAPEDLIRELERVMG